MFNLVSLIIGFVALICALVAFIPLLGWANWLIIPLAIIGAGVGMISRSTAGRNLNLFVIVVGVVRLMLAAESCEPRTAHRRLHRQGASRSRGRSSRRCASAFTPSFPTSRKR